MKKFLSKSLLVEKRQSSLRITVSPSTLTDWCLCLQLLHENLIEAFVFLSCASSHLVEVTFGDTSHYGSICQRDRLTVVLCERDLDYARHFFFRYYRDGIAEVDHIDIQAEGGDYITILVEEPIPPVSSEEAKRRLGM